jgi:hypothetical protein
VSPLEPDPEPAPDPTSDKTPFFSDFKDAKKSYFFLITYPQAHYLPPTQEGPLSHVLLVSPLEPDPEPVLDPTSDPTPFFSDFKDAKIFLFFSYKLPAGTLSSVLKI